jgi:choline dehydrogenase-like flavoprotein
MNVTVEDELRNENRVSVDSSGNVAVHFQGHSAYAARGAERSLALLPEVLAPLPVEKIVFKGYRPSESHLQGTLRMGRNRADSVVDRSQVHHGIRNLIVVGTSVLPTCTPVAPSLTAAALSLRAADIAAGKAPSW